MPIDFIKEGHIAKVGINVPETKNAISPDMLIALCNIWDECQADDHIRTVIIYSALPDIFCAGLDLKNTIPFMTGQKAISTPEERYLFSEADGFKGFSKALLKVKDLEKPVIVAVNGICFTSGFELSMACEFRLATEDAKFQMRETTLGIMPMGGGNVFLPQIVGATRALEILMTGDQYPAAKLYEWGYLNKVVATKDELMQESMKLAEKLASNGPKSIRGMVKMNRRLAGMTLAQGFDLEIDVALPVFRSGDPIEGVKAQKEKRKANYSN